MTLVLSVVTMLTAVRRQTTILTKKEEEEEGFEAHRSVVTATDLKKGTATGVIDGESITVNIKAIVKDLKARLGRNLEEDEWEVWARIPVGDVDKVLGFASWRTRSGQSSAPCRRSCASGQSFKARR